MEQKRTLTEELGYYISPSFYAQLQRGKAKVLKSNLDRIYVIDGREGEAGKSTLGMQLAYAIDPTFNLNNIVFASRDFEKKIRELGKHKALVWDESFRGLSSKSALSKQNKKLVQLLQECRQRSLFIFIILPSIFLLEKYVSIFRSQALIHAFCSKKSVNRRYYKVYNYRNKKLLCLYGNKMMSYSKPRVSKSHRFYNKLPLTIKREDYEAKKLAAFRNVDEEKPVETKTMKQRNSLATKLHIKYGESFEMIAKGLEKDKCPLTSSVIGRFVRDRSKKATNDSDIYII